MAKVYCGGAWRIILFGGGNGSGLNSDTWFWTYAFNTTSGTWGQGSVCTIGTGSNVPTARQTFALEYSPGDTYNMLFGGLSPSSPPNALGGTYEFQA
jgi:hypothetical protein